MKRLALLALPVVVLVTLGAAAQDKAPHSAVKPVPQVSKWWQKQHEKFVGIAKKGRTEVLFLGDSITDAWGGAGHSLVTGAPLFAQEFEPLKTANFGISGDRTQHVLWRLQNGELDGMQPKVVMLLIGTNNSNGSDNTAEEIAAGVQAIVAEIHKRSPKTKILLLAIFPRADKKTPEENKAQRDKIKKVNDIIGKLDDGGKSVKYLDLGPKFLAADGTLPKEIMPDQLHLSAQGYQIWADAVKGPIQELLGKK